MAWAPDYVTPDDLREYVTSSDVVIEADENQYPRAIAAASRAIDRHCRRQFGLVAAPEVRYYMPRWDSRLCAWTVDIDDLMTSTGFEEAGTPVASPMLYPRNAGAKGEPWTQLLLDDTIEVPTRGDIDVTAQWGWTSVPVAVEEACLLQAARFSSRRKTPLGMAGSPGSEQRLPAKVDPDVAVSLGSYVRRAMPR